GLEADRRGVGGDRVGQIAGRGARHGLEAELTRPGQRYRYHPILERVSGIGGVVLDPQLLETEAFGKAIGPQQRSPSRGERSPGWRLYREKVPIAPQRVGPGLDPP